MTVDYKTYAFSRREFFAKHGGLNNTATSPMYEDGRYTKTYTCEDGAQWTEIMFHCVKQVKASVELCDVVVPVEMQGIEFWNTDDAKSNFYYEPWDIKFTA